MRIPRLRWMLASALLLGVLILVLQLFRSRATLEVERSRIDVAWLKVEEDLERRASSIPRLISILNEPRRQNDFPQLQVHRRALADEWRSAGNAPDASSLVLANTRLEIALKDFRDTASRIPGDRVDADLQRLLEEVLAVESRIHQDRTEYNEAVQRYNVRLALFPSNLAATVFGLRRHELYLPTELPTHGGAPITPHPPSKGPHR